MSAGAVTSRRMAFGWKSAAGGASAAVALGIFGLSSVSMLAKEAKPDWNKVKKDIAAILEEEGYDDGHIGPLLVRLAWHCSGMSPDPTHSARA
jgi:hypothetical protein